MLDKDDGNDDAVGDGTAAVAAELDLSGREDVLSQAVASPPGDQRAQLAPVPAGRRRQPETAPKTNPPHLASPRARHRSAQAPGSAVEPASAPLAQTTTPGASEANEGSEGRAVNDRPSAPGRHPGTDPCAATASLVAAADCTARSNGGEPVRTALGLVSVPSTSQAQNRAPWRGPPDQTESSSSPNMASKKGVCTDDPPSFPNSSATTTLPRARPAAIRALTKARAKARSGRSQLSGLGGGWWQGGGVWSEEGG